MKIFLSSTYRDLRSIRSRIALALESAGYPLNRMEIFNSRPELPLDVCLKEVAKSNLVILIIASNYGSIEEKSQLSYTHLEFRHALTLDIPILGYIATRGKHKDDDNLKTFISEVTDSIKVTQDLTTTTIPEHAVAGVLRYIREHGEGPILFRTFQTSGQYFESLLNADALFNHTHPLMGHEDQLEHILEFVSSDQLILVLSGAGGTGKSRLLLEFATKANANASPSVRFLAPNIQLSDDAFRELPTIAQCIVIDDAHRQENLDSWIRACLQRGPNTKVVISTRPWGMPVVDLTLSSIPAGKITRLKELQPLDLELHAPALAKRVLGSQYEHLADQLVATSGGIPLVITVGGMCVRNGEILPALLDRKEEFQSAALDRLVFRVPEQINGVDRNRLLSVIAAVSPFRIDDESTLHIIANFLGVQRSQLSQAISELTTTWSLLTGGYVTRIVPDVLSDHLLYRACVASPNTPTGYVEELVSHFWESLLGNVLQNVAELQWRSQLAGDDVDILATTWNKLFRELPSFTNRQRHDLLQLLTRIATLLPDKTYQVVQWMLVNEEAPEDDQLATLGLRDGPDTVRDNIPAVLNYVAQHPHMTRQCCRLIWPLALRDSRRPNQFPYHPIRVLEDLASYQANKYYAVQRETVSAMADVVHDKQHHGHRVESSPVQVLSKALEREGEHRRSSGHTLTLGSFAVPLEQVREIRENALEILVNIATDDDLYHARLSVEAIAQLLHRPHGRFGRAVPDNEVDIWAPEAVSAANLLGHISSNSSHAFIQYWAKRQLREYDSRFWPAIEGAIADALETSPSVADEDVFESLKGLPRDYEDSEARLEQYGHLLNQTADTLWNEGASVSDIVGRIDRAAEGMNEAFAGDVYFEGNIMAVLAGEHSESISQWLDCIAALKGHIIQLLLPEVLRTARRETDRQLLREFVRKCSASDDIRLRQIICAQYQQICRDEPLERDDLTTLACFLDDTDPSARSSALASLGFFKDVDSDEALKLFIQADWTSESQIVERIMMAFRHPLGFCVDGVSDEHIDEIIQKLSGINKFVDGDHNISEFISSASKRRPAAVVSMLLNRIETDALDLKREGDDYQPIPHSVAQHLNLRGLRDSDQYRAVLNQIRDAALNDDWPYYFWLPKLFASACGSIRDAMPVIMEWAESDSEEKVIAASVLLKGFHEGVVFSEADNIAKLLTKAGIVGQTCYDRVSSNLFGLAIGGVYSSAPGHPSPRLVNDIKQADRLIAEHQNNIHVRKFYESLKTHAEDDIKRKVVHDEEMFG